MKMQTKVTVETETARCCRRRRNGRVVVVVYKYGGFNYISYTYSMMIKEITRARARSTNVEWSPARC